MVVGVSHSEFGPRRRESWWRAAEPSFSRVCFPIGFPTSLPSSESRAVSEDSLREVAPGSSALFDERKAGSSAHASLSLSVSPYRSTTSLHSVSEALYMYAARTRYATQRRSQLSTTCYAAQNSTRRPPSMAHGHSHAASTTTFSEQTTSLCS